ncbi:hypothetical protein [Mycobacterium asiaticum]|uniref:hypothetical protein n=1 Tax=Mycobacterium asiaticum TaxID=1790 RepID=UPI00114E5CC2|nr:hypothetical protein [Mycobacterium asiaticum]
MANPAVLLFNHLVQWNPPTNNQGAYLQPRKHRNLTSNFDHALKMHEVAMSYIGQIRELLDTLEQTTDYDVDEYRSELPNWTAMVLSYDNGWQNGVPFDGASLRWLKTLGSLLDNLVPKYDDEDVAALSEGLNELLRLVAKEKTLNRSLTVYLLTLINHVRYVLHDYHLRGDFELARATTLLRETIRTAGDASTNQELKPWYKKLLGVFSQKEVLPSTLQLGTAVTKAIEASQGILPPGHGG